MAKNKVENVAASSNALLRDFENDDGFFDPKPAEVAKPVVAPDTPPEEEPEVEVEPADQKPAKPQSTRQGKKQTPSKKEKQVKKSINLYLPVEDIEYLQDLARVLGLKGTNNVILAWVATHKKNKYDQVQAAIKEMEDRQKLLKG